MEASEGLGLSGPDSPRLYQMIKDEILDGEPVEDGHQDDVAKTHDELRRVRILKVAFTCFLLSSPLLIPPHSFPFFPVMILSPPSSIL